MLHRVALPIVPNNESKRFLAFRQYLVKDPIGCSSPIQQLNTLQTVALVSHTQQMGNKEKNGQAARLISTSKLNASLRLHIWPINLVVYQEPSETLRSGRSHLVEGFTLRCLQRFSRPDVATRRCRWRDNRYTRGPSNPVLSY